MSTKKKLCKEDCEGPGEHTETMRRLAVTGLTSRQVAARIGHPNSLPSVERHLREILGTPAKALPDDTAELPPWKQLAEMLRILRSDSPDPKKLASIESLIGEVYREG